MVVGIQSKREVASIEKQLAQHEDPKQRILLIDKLVSYFVYTNLEKSKSLLEDQLPLLITVNNPDFTLNYHWNKALVLNQYYDYLGALAHFEKALQLLNDIGDVQQLIDANIDYAGTLINLRKYDEVEATLLKVEKYLKSFPNPILKARLIAREGVFHQRIGNFSKATQLLIEAENRLNAIKALDLKDYFFLTIVYSGLGNLFQKNGEPKKSVREYQKAVKICERFNMRSRLSWHYQNAGTGFMAVEDYSNAEKYFLKAIDSKDDINEISRANAYANLGFVYLEKEDYEEALKYLDKAEDLYGQPVESNFRNFSNIEYWRGMIYEAQDSMNDTVKHIGRAIEFADKANDYRQLADLSLFLSDLYKDKNDFKSAFLYLQSYADNREAYDEEVERRKERELQIKYEAEQKEKEAEMFRLQATKLQLKALRAQMNPHFIYNALNAIQGYITDGKVTNASTYLAQFAELMRSSLEFSDKESLLLEEEIAFLTDYLDISQKLRYKNAFTYEINVDDELEEDILCVPSMIVQPYVENALEHGLRSIKNGHVSVDFEYVDEESLLCVIEDNGIGRDKAAQYNRSKKRNDKHRPRGTKITEDRLRLLDNSNKPQYPVKTIDLFDKGTNIPTGTRVEVLIPIVDIKID